MAHLPDRQGTLMRDGAEQLHLDLSTGGQQRHARRRFRFWARVLALTILLVLLA